MTILHLDASINGENSASRAISRSIVEQLKSGLWGEEIVYRDLAANPLPHLTLDAFADTSVIDEFFAADHLRAWTSGIQLIDDPRGNRPAGAILASDAAVDVKDGHYCLLSMDLIPRHPK